MENTFASFLLFLKKQNELRPFAKEIGNGTTVYFSDEFAAAYDAIIHRLHENGPIIIQESRDEEFDAFAIKTWLGITKEVWIVHPELSWIKRAYASSSGVYQKDDLFQPSSLPGVSFRLSDIE